MRKGFDVAEVPYQFLTAFGNMDTTIKQLRAGSTCASNLPGGVLQWNNIHFAVTNPGAVTQTLAALRASPAIAKAKAKFILATDGDTFKAEDVDSGETVTYAYTDFPNQFGFFLPWQGSPQSNNSVEAHSTFDIRATGRLNRLYVESLKDNPDRGTADRRPRHEPLHGPPRRALLLLCAPLPVKPAGQRPPRKPY